MLRGQAGDRSGILRAYIAVWDAICEGPGEYVDLLDTDPDDVARRLLAPIGMTLADLTTQKSAPESAATPAGAGE